MGHRGRYPDRVAASQALDAAIADRGSLNDYRLVSEDRRGVQRWLMIGVVVLAVVVVLSLWQIVD